MEGNTSIPVYLIGECVSSQSLLEAVILQGEILKLGTNIKLIAQTQKYNSKTQGRNSYGDKLLPKSSQIPIESDLHTDLVQRVILHECVNEMTVKYEKLGKNALRRKEP